MRLIDADDLKRFIDCGHLRSPIELCFSEIDVVRMLDKQPTIDAVEVVRCKECKYRKDPFVCPMCGDCVAPEGEDWGVYDWAEDDGFCHKGERRDDHE